MWCHGGINGRPDEGLHFDLHTGDGLVENSGVDFQNVHMRSGRWQWPGPCSLLISLSLCYSGVLSPSLMVSICMIIVRPFY